ncbi:MAG: hypothetical protein RIQ89_814 [Bacteroidota bacterium]|jgi:hypothetical protein
MKIVSVKHVKKYQLIVTFSDQTKKKVDLANFLKTAINPMTVKFRDLKLFSKVKITHGHLSWGDSEMDLSASDLYDWKNDE